MESLRPPDFKKIRKIIEEVPKKHIRNAFKLQYLTGARVSEVCGRYRILKGDMWLDKWEDKPVLVFRFQTAKRHGRDRHIGLPLNPKYEPWSLDLKEYFESGKHQVVFNYHKRTLQNYGEKYLSKLQYPIETYKVKEKVIPEHLRSTTTHGLRHLRSVDLVLNFKFDPTELTIFMGWSFQSALGSRVGASIDRYLYLQWWKYIGKLFKPI